MAPARMGRWATQGAASGGAIGFPSTMIEAEIDAL